jgi:hypothetical protein
VAGNTSGENDDPFAYLYRSETPAPPAQQPLNQPTQQFPALGPDAAATYGGAPTQYVGQQQPQYAPYQPQPGAQPGMQPGPLQPLLGPKHGGPPAGPWQEPTRKVGPLGAAAVVVVLLVVAGLGIWAMLGGPGGDKSGDQAAASTESSEPQPTPTSASPSAVSFDPVTVTADKLQLAGGAVLATDHKGYTGAGFVAGLENKGAALAWTVEVPKAGRYRLDVRYSNALGNDGQQIERRIGLTANGQPFGQIRMPVIGNWDSWGDTWRTVKLRKGENQIVIACGEGDSCHVNIDTLKLTRS